MPDINDIPPAPDLRPATFQEAVEAIAGKSIVIDRRDFGRQLELFPPSADTTTAILLDSEGNRVCPNCRFPIEPGHQCPASRKPWVEPAEADPAVYLQLGPLRIKGAWLWAALFAFLCAAWIVGITYLGARP